MKVLHAVSGILLVVSIGACGKGTQPLSEMEEAPDQKNAYSRLSLATKPYDKIRVSAQNADMQRLWSGFYWPQYQGGISRRWQLKNSSKDYQDYVYSIEAFSNYAQLQSSQMQQLSPAEKYDIWLSNASMSLTWAERNKVLATAKSHEGVVPTWYGICDGWALATSVEPEPVKIVRAQSANGQLIDFYPEDIKALMSYYYATAPKQFVMSGGRCNRKTVTKDDKGRVIEAECRDANPATLHLALDRYVGDDQSKLILDFARDEQVWNYPIQSYQIQYSQVRKLQDDPNYLHAAPNTEYLIDVTTRVKIAKAIGPSIQLGPHRDLEERSWNYVLELDRNFNIIGGEWISEERPDFMWLVQTVSNSSRVDYRALSSLARASHD